MKSTIWPEFFVWSFLFLIVILPVTAAAHGTDHRVIDPESAIAVEFVYSDNAPLRYAEVLVFSPENDEVEYQNGRTDRNGRFVFYPDQPGSWHIQANDGTGHLEKVSVDVKGGSDTHAEMGAADNDSGDHVQDHSHSHDRIPRLWAIILGISLIANIFLAFYLSKARRK